MLGLRCADNCCRAFHILDLTLTLIMICRPAQRGMAPLPDLHVSDSSEAMLSGRKPPFRLLVKCVHSDGRRINIRHAVSEGFVVRLVKKPCLGNVSCLALHQLPHECARCIDE